MKSIILLLFALPLLGAPVNHNAPVNRNYGRVSESNTVEYAPISLRLGNIVNGRAFPHPVTVLNPSATQYAVQGWLPVVTNPPPVFVRGYEAVSTGHWYVTNGVIRLEYVMRALPPRNLQLSKMKLKANMRQIGIWSNVWQMVSSDPDLLSDWNDSVVFDERNEFVQGAFSALEAAGLTPELREFIITNSVTEIEVRQ